MEASKELIKAQDAVVTREDLDNWLMGSDTKLTEKQKKLFYQVAISCQLNPIKREIYAIPYGNNFNIITGYEVYLKRAERTGLLDAWTATVEKRDDEYVGVCTVKRKDRSEPTTIEAWFNEYNQNNKMWREKPRTMIRKVAIAQAFRMVFPDELGGLPYTSDEMPTVDAEIVPEPKQIPKEEKKTKPKQEPKNDIQEKITKALEAASSIGYGQEDLEEWLGPVDEWTETHLDQLREWYKKNKTKD